MIFLTEAILFYKQNKQQFLFLLFVLFIILITLTIGWSVFSKTDAYRIFDQSIKDVTGNLSILFAQFLGYRTEYIQGNSQLIFINKIIHPVIPIEAFKFYFIAFCCLFLVHGEYIFKSLIILSTILFVIIRAVLISTISLLFFNQIHFIWLLFLEPLIFVPIFFVVVYVLKNNPLINILLKKINSRFNENLQFRFTTVILMVIIITPMPRIILTYLNGGILDFITNQTLIISRQILHLFDFKNVIISGKTIYLDHYWIQLENPCLGIGIFTIISILIFSLKGNWLNKTVYFIMLFPFLTFINGIRIAILLIYFQKNFGSHGINLRQLHDTSSNIIYFTAFALFVLYLFWFRDIKLSSNKRSITTNGLYDS